MYKLAEIDKEAIRNIFSKNTLKEIGDAFNIRKTLAHRSMSKKLDKLNERLTQRNSELFKKMKEINDANISLGNNSVNRKGTVLGEKLLKEINKKRRELADEYKLLEDKSRKITKRGLGIGKKITKSDNNFKKQVYKNLAAYGGTAALAGGGIAKAKALNNRESNN